MRIIVIGAGALGSLVGGILSKRHDVTVIGRPSQVEVLNQKGIKIQGLTRGEYHPRALVELPEGERFDLIILCVKSYNTDLTLGPMSKIMNEDTWILSLQNGLDNEERIKDFLRRNSLPGRIMGGITCHGVTYKGPGLVKHAGKGDTMIGDFDGGGSAGQTEEIRRIAQHFKKAGMDVDVVDSIDREIWAKTIINSVINPITAITGKRNGILVENLALKEIARQLIREGVAVAKAYGLDITEEEMVERTMGVAARTASNRSSMLQDIMRKRRTEIDSINGAIYHKGKEVGMDSPVNWSMYKMVRGMEDSYLEGDP